MKTEKDVSNMEELLNSELETVQGGAGSCVCDNGGAGQIVIDWPEQLDTKAEEITK